MRFPKIVYNSITLTFSLAAQPWLPATRGVGAGVESGASGVPSAWKTRREYALEIVQRITEAEWPGYLAFLEWAQDGNAFAWYPDAGAGTSHTCYLVSPTIDEYVRPDRDTYPGDMVVKFTIRRTDGALIDEDFFV